MAGVFISYRREDSPGHAGRTFDRLRVRLGTAVVFMDVHAIDAGADFLAAVERAVGSREALLAIIGPGWLTAADDDGRRRLDDPKNAVVGHVRNEPSDAATTVRVVREGKPLQLPVVFDPAFVLTR